MNAVHYARIINALSGGALIAPWEVGQLSQEWMDTFWMMGVQMPKAQDAARENKNIIDEIKRKHPQFGQRYRQ